MVGNTDQTTRPSYRTWLWLLILWLAGFAPQWMTWSHGWNVLGALFSIVGIPLAAVLLGIGTAHRDNRKLLAAGTVAALSIAVFAGADEQLRARVTLLSHRNEYLQTVRQFEANPSLTGAAAFVHMHSTDKNFRFAFIVGQGPCCESKAIVYDPTGSVMKMQAETSDEFHDGETVVAYARHMTGPWYYCVML